MLWNYSMHWRWDELNFVWNRHPGSRGLTCSQYEQFKIVSCLRILKWYSKPIIRITCMSIMFWLWSIITPAGLMYFNIMFCYLTRLERETWVVWWSLFVSNICWSTRRQNWFCKMDLKLHCEVEVFIFCSCYNILASSQANMWVKSVLLGAVQQLTAY